MHDLKRSVTVVNSDGEWAVYITDEDGADKTLFRSLEFAMNFAEGQRIRLGLPKAELRVVNLQEQPVLH